MVGVSLGTGLAAARAVAWASTIRSIQASCSAVNGSLLSPDPRRVLASSSACTEVVAWSSDMIAANKDRAQDVLKRKGSSPRRLVACCKLASVP